MLRAYCRSLVSSILRKFVKSSFTRDAAVDSDKSRYNWTTAASNFSADTMISSTLASSFRSMSLIAWSSESSVANGSHVSKMPLGRALFVLLQAFIEPFFMPGQVFEEQLDTLLLLMAGNVFVVYA